MSTETLLITTPSDREIVLTRVFDAPRRLVFDCFTKPELLKRWGLGPRDWTLIGCEIDLRVGGEWRFIMTSTGGQEMIMCGVYRDIAAPERFVQTERFEKPALPGETLNTYTFAENDGKTTLAITVLCASKELRDNVLKSGMEGGASTSYERLAELLPSFIRETDLVS
jgi:uncharacterized protein YndB with AHSA1/START domain